MDGEYYWQEREKVLIGCKGHGECHSFFVPWTVRGDRDFRLCTVWDAAGNILVRHNWDLCTGSDTLGDACFGGGEKVERTYYLQLLTDALGIDSFSGFTKASETSLFSRVESSRTSEPGASLYLCSNSCETALKQPSDPQWRHLCIMEAIIGMSIQSMQCLLCKWPEFKFWIHQFQEMGMTAHILKKWRGGGDRHRFQSPLAISVVNHSALVPWKILSQSKTNIHSTHFMLISGLNTHTHTHAYICKYEHKSKRSQCTSPSCIWPRIFPAASHPVHNLRTHILHTYPERWVGLWISTWDGVEKVLHELLQI